MEDGLVLAHSKQSVSLSVSLNPCCNGRWSRTIGSRTFNGNDYELS